MKAMYILQFDFFSIWIILFVFLKQKHLTKESEAHNDPSRPLAMSLRRKKYQLRHSIKMEHHMLLSK